MDFIEGNFFYHGRPLGPELENHLIFQHESKWSHVSPGITVADALLQEAAKHIQRAITTRSLSELAVGIITIYGWQIANGAPVLPNQGELAKMHHKIAALYLWSVPKSHG